jgi:hypothetical protein
MAILSGRAASAGDVPSNAAELGALIAEKEAALGAMEVERCVNPGPERDLQIDALTKELDALRSIREALGKVRILNGLEQAGVVLAFACKIGIPGIVSLSFERTMKIGQVDRKTGKRSHESYTSLAIKGPAYAEIVTRGFRQRPSFAYGGSIGWTIFAKNHPVYGDRAGIWIPLVGEAELSSKGLMGGMIVTPSFLVPCLHLGWKLYVQHPGLARFTIPAFGVVDSAVSKLGPPITRAAKAVVSAFKGHDEALTDLPSHSGEPAR